MQLNPYNRAVRDRLGGWSPSAVLAEAIITNSPRTRETAWRVLELERPGDAERLRAQFGGAV